MRVVALRVIKLKQKTTWILLIVILLAAFFLREYRLLDFPYHGDEVDEGDIALDILRGHLAPFYPQNEGNEPLYQFTLAPFFAILGDSVIANRFPSVAWSMVLVVLMYAYGRTLFRSRRVGVMAAALTASLWWSTIFGRLGLREISQPVMMVPALLALIALLRATTEREARRWAFIGALFAGLTHYTFLSGRGFPAIVVLLVIYLALFQRELFQKRWRALLVYAGVMMLLALPLHLYLWLNPGLDFHVSDLSARGWLMQGDWQMGVTNIVDTLGMFTVRGDMNWVRNIEGRPVFVGIERALFYLGVALAVWRWRKPEYALQLIVIAVMLVPNVLAENPPRWTRSIGILPGLLLVPVLPLEWLWARFDAREWRTRAVYAAFVVLVGISIYARTATDLFQVWLDNPNIYGMTLAYFDGAGKYVNQSPDATPLNYVMDVFLPWRKTNIQRVIQRRDVAVRYSTLNALVLPEHSQGWRVAFQIFGAPSRPLLDAFVDLDAPLYVDPRLDSEGRRLLRVYAISRARFDEHLARARANKIYLPNTSMPIQDVVRVGDSLEFLGYEMLNADARAADELNMLTFWRVLKRPPSVAAFVHLLDANQNVVAQFDGFDAVTEDLMPGDVVVQLHPLKLPDNLRAGTYRFALGVYTRDDLQRLPLSVGADSLWLTSWRFDSP